MKKKNLTLIEVQAHKETAVNILSSFMDSLIKDPATIKKANLLSYWLEDYTRYLSSENTFNPKLYKKYERGDVIKVNLGFNVGSEEGGLHYAVVLDKANPISSPTLTIVPLSSIKDEKIHLNDVNLGTQIYDALDTKIKNYFDSITAKFTSKEDIEKMSVEQLNETVAALQEADKMVRELSKMKSGSIAVVNQITTISKQRIYDPKTMKDILAGVRISDENLDKINEKVKNLYVW